jgi:integrase
MMADKKRKTARRGNGEGSIFQRGDGRWCARVTIGYDANGKRKRRDVYGWTKKEVQDKLTGLMAQKQNGTLAATERETVGEFIEWWLTNEVKPNRRASTHASYRQIAVKHILPYLGGLQLSRLQPSNVGSLYATLQSAGCSARLVQMVHAVLRRALGRGVKLGKLVRNACDAVERPQADRHEIQTLNQDQARAFVLALQNDRLKPLFLLAITGGLRQGELFGLKWDDIDFNAAAVSVRRTIVQLGNEFIINEPKTAKGRRRVELPALAMESLHEHRRQMMIEGRAGSEWVFVGTTGKPLRRSVVRKQLRKLLSGAGLPGIRFHDLRHSCASLLMAGGTHAKVVQERLGHSTINLTLDTYSHVLPTMQREAANSLDELFRQTGS